MKWRCEWCGKPHDEDDPPCDNCGHGTFEKAVVQDTSQKNDQNSTIVWVCTKCGREHTKHSPPCSRCNNATLERTRKEITAENLTERPGSGNPTATTSAETTTLWVCPDCGREHTKHSPPCSRCGNPELEQQTKRVGADELAAPSYVDLLTPQYVAVLGVVLLIAGVFVLGFTGVVDIPFFPDNSVPEVEDPPGEGTELNGLVLADVEAAYLSALNDGQRAANSPELDRSEWLDDVATYYNQQQVDREYGEGTGPQRDEMSNLLGQECSGQVTIIERAVPVDDRSADALGSALGGQVATPLDASGTTTGIDVHAVENQLLLTQFVCQG